MNATRWWAAGLAVIGIVSTATAEANVQAQLSRGPVLIDFANCEQSLEAEVRRIVGVELRASAVETVSPGQSATRLVAICRGSEVDLVLEDSGTSNQLVRTLPLAEAVPTGRARLLALAVAELVVASWQERQSDPVPMAPSPSPDVPSAPVADAVANARLARTSVGVEAMGVVRVFPGASLWLLGAGARGVVALSRPLVLTIDGSAEWGQAARGTGQVRARVMAGALGLAWGIDRAWAFIMPWMAARAGVARLAGEPNVGSSTAGETQSGMWLGPEIGACITFLPRAPMTLTLALSVGVTMRGVRGDVVGESSVSMRGPWAALVAGVGFAKR